MYKMLKIELTFADIDRIKNEPPRKIYFKEELMWKALFREVDYYLHEALIENGYKGIFKKGVWY